MKLSMKGTKSATIKLIATLMALLLTLSACGNPESPGNQPNPSSSNSGAVPPTSGDESTTPSIEPTDLLVTEPPATEPPATEPPATEPPATDPPTTEPPATEPPATEPPATEPPATEPPATQPTGIVFLSWPETTSRNKTVTVTIQGAPNTKYSITVYYKSGPSTADGLEDKASDASGKVSWTWHIGGRTSTGTFKITVSGGGKTETVKFTIVA